MTSVRQWRPSSVPSAWEDQRRRQTVYVCPLLERLAQDFEDMVVISGDPSQHKIPWCTREISSGSGTCPPPLSSIAASV
jgi:hypothetical protein